MGKESKNLGITKACPECKKIVIRDGNFNGSGSFKIKCPHCVRENKDTLIEIKINPQTTMLLSKIAVISAIIILIALNGIQLVKAQRDNNKLMHCYSFQTIVEAQNYADAKLKGYKGLYKNSVGKVCTRYFSRKINQ